MKKILTLVSCSLFVTIVVHAQQKQPKYFAQLAGGPSFPLGKFAGKTFEGITEPNPSGLAQTGMAAQLSLGYYINKSIGVLLLPGYSVHKQISTGYDQFITSHWTPDDRKRHIIKTTTKSWKLTKLMAGGFFVTPLTESNALVLITKLTAGVCKTDIPGYNYTMSDTSGSVEMYVSQGKIPLHWAFCYQVGVGLKYKLKNNWHLLFDIDSFNSTPEREFWYSRATPVNAGPQIAQHVQVKYKLAEVNALLGIGIDF